MEVVQEHMARATRLQLALWAARACTPVLL